MAGSETIVKPDNNTSLYRNNNTSLYRINKTNLYRIKRLNFMLWYFICIMVVFFEYFVSDAITLSSRFFKSEGPVPISLLLSLVILQ
jgi:capsule polysaccharide export protein KpsE/RkpR